MSVMRAMRRMLVNVALLLVAVMLAFVIAEAAYRWKDNRLFYTKNFVLDRWTNVFQSTVPAMYDPVLGVVPKPGSTTGENIWTKEVDIDERGLRLNGRGVVPPMGPLTLATGDSFTFGDQVSNHESWPAHLERLLGTPVANGGVFGYGFDQTVLRTESLIAQLHPKHIVVSLIDDDINRLRMKRRTGVAKPYFSVEGGALALKNVPCPKPEEVHDVPGVRAWLGYSYILHRYFLKHDPGWWGFRVDFTSNEEFVDVDENAVACLLAGRLAASSKKADATLLVVYQYGAHQHERAPKLEQLKACFARDRVPVLDLFDAQEALYRSDPARHAAMFVDGVGHMSDAGNRFVAEQIATVVIAEKARAARPGEEADE